MKLLIMQFAPVVLLFLPLWTQRLPRLHILEHNPPVFFHTLKVRNLYIIPTILHESLQNTTAYPLNAGKCFRE
jgi:hypothetical protein